MRAKFLQAVENKDLISIKLFIAAELMLNPRGHSFQEMLGYASESLFEEDLYEKDDGKRVFS